MYERINGELKLIVDGRKLIIQYELYADDQERDIACSICQLNQGETTLWVFSIITMTEDGNILDNEGEFAKQVEVLVGDELQLDDWVCGGCCKDRLKELQGSSQYPSDDEFFEPSEKRKGRDKGLSLEEFLEQA